MLSQKKPPQTILVIDDDKEFRDTIADILFDSGYEVMTAGDGFIAMKILLNSYSEIDLVITDIMMPEMDGHKILELIYNDKELKSIPVLVVTADKRKKLLKESFKNGAIDFLNKPFDSDSLIAAIEKVFKNEKNSQSKNINLEFHNEYKSVTNKLDDINVINSHGIKHANAVILQVIELVDQNELDTESAISHIHSMSKEIEELNQEINKITNIGMSTIEVDSINSGLSDVNLVWFIDDNKTINSLHTVMAEIHLNKNFQVFSDAESALELIENDQRPDLIFLDLSMPGLSGFDFLDILETEQVSIPVIILTSSIQPSDKLKSFSYNNVVTYLTKPLKKEILMLINSK
ncbi:MAG: response regulator [Gracilimonas sp.]|nr:response regulator [Gracilimonas sp.]